MSSCKHDMAEQDTAVADGLCPLCLQSRIAELEQPWVSVEERLPDEGEVVEAIRDTGDRIIQEITHWDRWWKMNNYTHWKARTPLPTPPEEQEG